MSLQAGCIHDEDTYLISKPPSRACNYFHHARYADKSSNSTTFTLVPSPKRRIFLPGPPASLPMQKDCRFHATAAIFSA